MRLSPVDHVFTGAGAYPINFLFFFESLIDEHKLKASLEKTLQFFSPVGSHLKKMSDETLEFDQNFKFGWNVQETLTAPDMSNLKDLQRYFKSAKSTVGENLLEVTLSHFQGRSALGVSLSHCVVDGYSYFMFLTSWSKAMRNLDFHKPDLDRLKLVPLEKAPFNEASVFEATGFAYSQQARPDDLNDIRWELIDYSEEDLKKLYSNTTAQSALRLSMNDVLCADLWKKLARKYQKSGEELTLACAFDYRRVYPKIGPLYFGNAVRGASFKLSYDELMSSTNALIAEKIGGAVRSINEEKALASLQYLESLRNKKGLESMTHFHVADPQTGFLMTNLSRLPLLELDFGAGAPVDFRILTPARRTAVILPLANGLRIQIAH